MKRLVVLTVLMTVVVGIPISILAKKDGSRGGAAQFCKANNNLGYEDLGQCVSIFRAHYGPGNSGPVGVCKEFVYNAPKAFYENYNSLDDCISHLRNGYVVE